MEAGLSYLLHYIVRWGTNNDEGAYYPTWISARPTAIPQVSELTGNRTYARAHLRRDLARRRSFRHPVFGANWNGEPHRRRSCGRPRLRLSAAIGVAIVRPVA